MRKFLALAAVGATAGITLVACGGDDSGSEAQAASFEMVQPASGDPTMSGPSSLKSGAVAVSFKNTGQAPADLQLVGVEGDHSVDEVLQVVGSQDGPIPDWLTGEGGVGTIAPGQTGTATVLLDKGKYYAIGEVDSEDDNGPPPASVALDVTGDGKGSLPSAGATIKAKEYSFDVKGLKAGSNTVKFENDGQQLHHLIAAPLADGATIEDVKKFVQTEGEPQGEPPLNFEASTGTAVIDKGRALVTTLDLKPGKYVFMCFMTNRDGGAPHAMQGMIQEVNIT